MPHSARIERIFAYAKQNWQDIPPTPLNRNFQYAAVELYADAPTWPRAPLALAYAIRHMPVTVTEDDEIIGRVYHLNRMPAEHRDPEMYDFMIHAVTPGETVYPGYEALRRLHLVTDIARGHITWDWRKMLRIGTEGMKAECRAALLNPRDEEAEHFYRGVLIMLEALEDWNDLHADRLEEMGKPELAARCRHVPRYPARNFREAVQAFFMQYIVVFCESPFGGNGPGQFDKYMWPYLKADLEAGICTLAEAREIIDELFIRMDERVSRGDLWNEMILAGGTHPDGTSAVSPLSTIMVESIMELNITHPSVYLRVPADADDDYIRLCARYLLHGNNRAQIYYDPQVIRALTETNHVRPEDATEYGVGGCLEIGIQGMNSDFLQSGFVNMPLMLELAITGGRRLCTGEEVDTAGVPLPGLAAFDRFEDFYENYLAYTDRLIGISFAAIEAGSIRDQTCRPTYLISSMINDCMARGRLMHAGGCRYHDHSMTPVGMPNVADALYAIKRAVFEEKLCTAEELLAALQADFAGHERLQRRLRAIPKYGQDNEEADRFASAVITRLTEMFVTRRTRFGGIFRPMILTYTYAPQAAEHLGATADGNHAHTMPAQAITPQSRSMSAGITAAMNSCTKMPFALFSGGASAMWDLDPAWATEEIVAHLLKTFFAQGGQVFQGNATDVGELLEAQKHPEDYRHLIVRVGGFSARFVGLDPALQTDIINRRRHRG